MSVAMDFRILGPVEVRQNGETLPLGGTKRRALLAILVLHANEVVSPDRLIDELWAEHPPQNAGAALHNHVSRLRKLLGADVLVTTPGGYCLRVAPASIDLNRFERLVGDADRAPALERTSLLREALDIWRGPALGDVSFEPFAATAIVRLEEARLAAFERKIDADLELGRHADVVGDLEALVAQHPLRERLRAQLILALYRAGRQADALDVYRETRRVLDEELGLEPSPELRELERAILRQDPALAAPEPVRAFVPPAGRRRTVTVAVAVLAILGVAAATASLALRPSEPSRVAAREPVRVTPSVAATPQNRAATTRTNVAVEQSTTRRETKPTPKPKATTTPSRPRRSTPPQTVSSKPSQRAEPAPAEKPRKPAPKKPELLRVSDDFAREGLDAVTWYTIGRENGADFFVRDGRLEISVAPDAVPNREWNAVGGHVATRCKFPGDFDARVEFTLLEWPLANNVYAGLNAFLTVGKAAVYRQSSAQWGDNYAAWIHPSTGSGLDVAERTGRFRLRRLDEVITSYVWYRDAWLAITSARARGIATIALEAQADGDEFGRKATRVAYDNFVVTAPGADCPYDSAASD